ncbi:poly(A) RNA polymerase, mitochondrial-like [Thrips palmi]|uniref:Poly(A) RNA polymerase, mitochondrial-like n=1 Tax=Thrips palmi TaxID=161013 RepID=A0A6P8YFP7_THRPL|nr:poly(A) RNA polymerase, mitochondrial-like [Thrips palmi]XP_034238554.1 poly(A) RNA polymerase, mitochondrial-like [Thrips palmi]
MYRKTGSDNYTSAENKYGYKSASLRMSERKQDHGFSSDHSSANKQLDRGRDSFGDRDRDRYSDRYSDDRGRERDVYIRSRTFQNSNWRQPNAWEVNKPPTQFESNQQLRKEPVNSFMPHFCVKKDLNYTPTLQAVDNLTPKFGSMEISRDTVTAASVSHQSGRSHCGASSSRPSQNNGLNSWRKECANYSKDQGHSSMSGSKRKVDPGVESTGPGRKSLMAMLGSKRSLYEAMNELDGKTMKVQVEDFRRQEQACEHLKQEMSALYPDCCVTPYATRLLGMAHPNTAIYMFFDPDGCSYFQATHENKDVQTKTRKIVYETLKNCGHCENVQDWDVQELVTFMHSETRMNSVVSFANGFKDQNTLLFKSYLKIDKRLRLLMLLVTDMVYRYQDFSKQFTSHVLNIMVIMFLQRTSEPVLPTLEELRSSLPYENIFIGGFNCGFPKDFTFPSSNHSSVENLLKEFCAFYYHFDFEEEIISLLGPKLKRAMFSPPYEISIPTVEPLNSYLLSLKRGDKIPKINCLNPVIVQEPFELSSNAAEKVECAVLAVFRMMCQDACDILSTWC